MTLTAADRPAALTFSGCGLLHLCREFRADLSRVRLAPNLHIVR